MHRIFGYALILFPVALLVLAVVGRQSWLKVGLNGLVIVLVVLQGAIINVAEGIGLPLFSALHPVNALLIFALCLALLYADWQDVRQSRAQA